MEWEQVIVVVKKDFIIYLVCLLSLLGCLYTIYTVGSYQQAINNAWLKQWEESGCVAEPELPQIQYRLVGGIYETENINNNT
uniref:Uncharacterized protein n=1 Tax=viral metagenome TaxID=1070528 RepID=A0A6M3IE52_9ZZZZ